MRSTHQSAANVAEAIKSGKLCLPEGYDIPDHGKPHDSFTSVREVDYRGKTIRVETTYKITIDRQPLRRHTIVLDDGTVHCHAFPNYSFPSALDLARKIVDASTVRFPKDELGGGKQCGGQV